MNNVLASVILFYPGKSSLPKQIRFTSPVHGATPGGISYIQGHVEILHQGTWGTICDDNMNDGAATVLCRMAGYSNGGMYSSAYKQPSARRADKIWLDDLTCKGSESHVDNCRHRPWGSNNCGHDEDIGIRCITEKGMEYNKRLI